MLTPRLLTRPRLLVPTCVCSLTLGLLLLSFLVFPERYPAVHDRMIARRLAPTVLALGILCVSLPITLLYWGVKHENSENV